MHLIVEAKADIGKPLKIQFTFNYVYVCGHVHESAGVLRHQRLQIPVGLGLQVVVSYPTWVLTTKFKSSAKVV